MTNSIDTPRQQKIVDLYSAFISFQTISANKAYWPQCHACATWISDLLQHEGCSVEQWTVDDRPPVIFATKQSKNPQAPTVLIYHHYDVQPIDPIDEWTSDPFTLRSEAGSYFGRGAQDNKGQCLYSLITLQELSELDCHIKLLIDGEEENGSYTLSKIFHEKESLLQADYTMIIDLGMKNAQTPAITLGCRGLIAVSLHIRGANQDLHSGAQGGVAPNPLQHASAIVSSFYRQDGSVAVAHFYDNIQLIDRAALSYLDLSFDTASWQQQFQQDPVGGERGYAPIFRNWLRPTLEINGIHGGYGGPGSKTVIPKEAIVKLSCRLVPGQDPQQIAHHITQHIRQHTPPGCSVEITVHEGAPAVQVDRHSQGISALHQAMQETFGREPSFILNGASIPIMAQFPSNTLLLWGLGLDSDAIHAPNEHFDITRIERGIAILQRTLALLGQNHVSS